LIFGYYLFFEDFWLLFIFGRFLVIFVPLLHRMQQNGVFPAFAILQPSDWIAAIGTSAPFIDCKKLLSNTKPFPRKLCLRMKKKCCRPGLPDFSWSKHTKTEKIYQMTTNYAKRL
jgi:hypothetical protein